MSAPWDQIAELTVKPDKPEPQDVTRRPEPTAPVRFEVTLDDASCVLGTPDQNHASVFGACGRLCVPWALVRRVSFHDDHETCTLDLWNGDALVGCVDWKAFGLATGLGRVQVSTVHTKQINLSLGGTDLVGKPYAAASGSRWFLGGLKAARPKRIGGRVRPAAHFIEAHASGRIEYTFEQPVREFHAVLTMYESYCAHKGSVVFKVETEHGPVYASRSLRNLEQEDVYLCFQPTRKLVLITDQNGSNQEDWSVWLYPEVR